MPSCGVTPQLRCESSSVTVAGRESFTRNYLLRLSDDIFMWCRESAGRHSRVHFPYGDIRRKTHTQTHTHTHTHTHVLYTEEFQCIADSCLVCVCTNHVVFLSLICHTCCTVMLPFVCIHSCGPYLFLPTWHTMCAIVCREEEGGGVICVGVLYLCVSSVTMQPHSISVQVVVTSQLFWISVSVLSQLSECLSWIFFFFLLHPFFYRNHCYKSYNHTRK